MFSKQSEGEFWADKLMDLANLSAVVLVIGQLVAEHINLVGFGIGIIFYAGMVILADRLRNKRG